MHRNQYASLNYGQKKKERKRKDSHARKKHAMKFSFKKDSRARKIHIESRAGYSMQNKIYHHKHN